MSLRSTFLSTLIWSLCFMAADGLGTLRLVNLVFRHGDRSPVVTYPKNPNPINTTWPQGLGWLTKEGMEMHYSLGRFIRRRYDGFLSQRYNHAELTVESSGLDRCLMSAYSNLAGLYPPSEDQVWNKNITWQPIPVHTRPENEDNMLAIDKPCPRYKQLYDASLKSDRIKKEEVENKAFYDFIKEETGYKSESIDNIWKIVDTLYCEKVHNVTTPTWANDTIYNRLRELWTMNFGLLFHGKEESRLKGGPLLKEWIQLAGKKVEEPSYKVKMNMYSGHDTTLVAVMSALKVYNEKLLPYASLLIMELHENAGGKNYVELYLRNYSSVDPNDNTQPYNLTLPGCEFQCPWETFVSLTENAIPGDWDAECSIESEPTEDRDYKTAFIAAVAVFSVAVLLLLVVVIVMCLKSRGSHGTKGFDFS